MAPRSAPPASVRSDDGPGSDSGEDQAWDEVDVSLDLSASALLARATAAAANLDIVLSGAKPTKGKKKGPSDGSIMYDRMVRQETHKLHLLTLLSAGLIRNRWANSQSLRARMLSHLPSTLYEQFNSVTKTSHPNDRDRSRMFDRSMRELVSWWGDKWRYTDGEEDNGTRGIQRRLRADVEEMLKEHGYVPVKSRVAPAPTGPTIADLKGKGKAPPPTGPRLPEFSKDFTLDSYTLLPLDLYGGDRLKHFAALEKRAREMKGSRDFSVLLFTALCRALDIPARLVFSLQPVDWRGVSSAGTTKKRKGVVSKALGQGEGGSTPASGSETVERDYRPKLRNNVRRKKVAQVSSGEFSRDASPDVDFSVPPVFWTEVYSRANRVWVTVDVVRKKVRCKDIMEPEKGCRENMMAYVLGFEEDNTCRDVTKRYAKKYSSVTKKARLPTRSGYDDWFDSLIQPYMRSFRLNRDEAEDLELENSAANETMPTSVAGFKDHPNYILARHLKRDEALEPGTLKVADLSIPITSKIKGGIPASSTSTSNPKFTTEPIYRRSAVLTLKSVESYLRVGRRVLEGEIPIKFVKSRGVTVNRKRQEEAMREENGGLDVEQGLFAWRQTEAYNAAPIVDGKIPRNDFGNIDLYVPSMLPEGGTHVPHKSAGRCAKKLGIQYADAVTGFEFKSRAAHPILTGVVVASGDAELLLEAVHAFEKLQDEKDELKRQERCLARWKSFILGLRIRQRVQATYTERVVQVPGGETSQFGSLDPTSVTTPDMGKRRAEDLPALETGLKQPKMPKLEHEEPPEPVRQARSNNRSIRFTLGSERVLPSSPVVPTGRDRLREAAEARGEMVTEDEDSDSSVEVMQE